MKKAVAKTMIISRDDSFAKGGDIFAETSQEEKAILDASEVIYMGVVAVIYKDSAAIIKAIGGLREMSGVPEKREADVKEFTKVLRKAMVEGQDALIAHEAQKYVKAGMRKPKTPVTAPAGAESDDEVGYDPS